MFAGYGGDVVCIGGTSMSVEGFYRAYGATNEALVAVDVTREGTASHRHIGLLRGSKRWRLGMLVNSIGSANPSFSTAIGLGALIQTTSHLWVDMGISRFQHLMAPSREGAIAG